MINKGNCKKGEIEITDEMLVFENKYIQIYNDNVLFPSNEAGTYIRVSCKPSQSVAVLPVTKEGKIVLIKTYRHGARGWGVEVPKGAVEPDENETDGAVRELKEETGYVCKKIIPLGEYSESPAIFSGRIKCFIATDCEFVNIPTPEKTEAISGVFEMSPNEFFSRKEELDYIDALSELLIYKYIISKGEQFYE